jgi:hypothetical protein
VAAVVSDKRHLRDIGGMFVGASLYAMVPTLVSKFFKVDTSALRASCWASELDLSAQDSVVSVTRSSQDPLARCLATFGGHN